MLLLEFVVRGDRVARHADDDGAGLCRNPGTSRGSRKPRRCSPTCRPSDRNTARPACRAAADSVTEPLPSVGNVKSGALSPIAMLIPPFPLPVRLRPRRVPPRPRAGSVDQPLVPEAHPLAGGRHIALRAGRSQSRRRSAPSVAAGRRRPASPRRARRRTAAPAARANAAAGSAPRPARARLAAAVRRPLRAPRSPRPDRHAAARARAAASRSSRYCTMNSRSISPPGRLRRSHGDGAGWASAMRRRMSATSTSSRSGSRCAGQRRPDRGGDAFAQGRDRRRSAAPGSAPCAPRSRPLRAGTARRRRGSTRSARIRRTAAAAYRPRRACPRRSAR